MAHLLTNFAKFLVHISADIAEKSIVPDKLCEEEFIYPNSVLSEFTFIVFFSFYYLLF